MSKSVSQFSSEFHGPEKVLPRWLPYRRATLSVSKKQNIPALPAASLVGCKALLPLLRYLRTNEHAGNWLVDGIDDALVNAVARDCYNCVEALVLGVHADPFKILSVTTATHIAASRGHCRALAAILRFDEMRMSTSLRDSFGLCPIHVAAMYGHVDVVALLVRHDAKALMIKVFPTKESVGDKKSIVKGRFHPRLTNELEIDECDPYSTKTQSSRHLRNSAGCTATHLAAGAGHANVLQEIVRLAYVAECESLQFEAIATSQNQNFSESCGRCANESQDTVDDDLIPGEGNIGGLAAVNEQHRALLDREMQDDSGMFRRDPIEVEVLVVVTEMFDRSVQNCTESNCVSKQGDSDFLSITVADILEVRDSDNYTPLLFAALFGSTKSALCLIHLGADLHVRGKHHRTVVHEASENVDSKMIELFVEGQGLAVDERDVDGDTALHYAGCNEEDNSSQISTLLEFGADVNRRNYFNQSPLFLSAVHGIHSSFVQLLLAGADPWSPCGWKKPHSPVLELARNRHFDTLLSLIDAVKMHKIAYDLQNDFHDKVQVLIECVKGKADSRVLRELLTSGITLSSEQKQEQSLLYLFSLGKDKKNLDIARLLVEAGADLDYADTSGWRAIHNASRNGDIEFVQFLIAHGANVNGDYQRPWVQTPLYVAVERNSADILKALISAGSVAPESADPHDMGVALCHAVQQNYYESAKALLEAGADLCAATRLGYTPLRHAVYSSSAAMMMLLLNAGSPMHSLASSGRVPLHFASEKCRRKVFCKKKIPILLARGAFVDVCDNSGNTPLHLAAANEGEAAVCALLDAGADINARNANGCDPFLLSAENGKLRNMVTLLSNGANFDSRDKRNRTALHIAVQSKRLKIMEYLLRNGADTQAIDEDGVSVFETALRYGRPKVIRSLIRTNCAQLLDAFSEKVIFGMNFSPRDKDKNDGERRNDTGGQAVLGVSSADVNSVRCSVCWLILLLGDDARAFRCGHMFHEACTISWLSSKHTRVQRGCPMCRQPLVEDGPLLRNRRYYDYY